MKRPMHSTAPSELNSSAIIEARASQLNGILTLIAGSGYGDFDGYVDSIKEGILSACADLADDLEWHVQNTDEHLRKE